NPQALRPAPSMSEEPIRSSFLFLPSYAPTVMYVAFFISGVIMLYGLQRHLGRYGVGLPRFLKLVTSDLGTKLKRFSKFALAERKILRRSSGGAMHAGIFYGFLLLLVYTAIV